MVKMLKKKKKDEQLSPMSKKFIKKNQISLQLRTIIFF